MQGQVLIVAATSARMLAESARRGGLRTIALDLFGDADTRRAAHWIDIGNPGRSGIDAKKTVAVLTRLASRSGLLGWVAGSGFEDRPGLLRDGAGALALIGNKPDVVAEVKNPGTFFALLDRCNIDHPEICLRVPPAGSGWLRKGIGGTGGGHVRRLRSGRTISGRMAVLPGTALPGVYYQRESGGVPMSALFLADGAGSSLVGINRMLVDSVANRPYVFHGAVGPVPVPEAAARAIRHAVGRIVDQTGLLGLNSMDFLLDDGCVKVLEINPRPSATMALHDAYRPRGLMAAHVAACRDRLLPLWEPQAPAQVNGLRVVYARRPCLATQATQSRLELLGWCHDIGSPGTRTGAGEPLCSVSGRAGCEVALIAQLKERERAIQQLFGNEDDD